MLNIKKYPEEREEINKCVLEGLAQIVTEYQKKESRGEKM